MTITTNAQLLDKLGKCKGGETVDDTINIAEPVELSGLAFPVPVTIAGARFAPSAPLAAEHSPVVALYGCTGIILDRAKIEGQPKPDRGFSGRGVYVNGGADIVIRRSDLSRLWNGVTGSRAARLTLDSNDISYIQTDGFIGLMLRDFSALANWFRKFFPTLPIKDDKGNILVDGDHADAIQVHSNGGATDDCDGLTIKNNLVDGFAEDMLQGFWLNDPHFGGHRRVSVEDNLLFSLLWNGIGVAGCANPSVLRNRLLKLIGSPFDPRIRTDGNPATLSGNEAPAYAFAKWDDPIPPGNKLNEAVPMAVIDAARSAWLAQFRQPVAPPTPAPPPAPSPADLLRAERAALQDQIDRDDPVRDAMTKAISKARTRIKAIDKALAKLPK